MWGDDVVDGVCIVCMNWLALMSCDQCGSGKKVLIALDVCHVGRSNSRICMLSDEYSRLTLC